MKRYVIFMVVLSCMSGESLRADTNLVYRDFDARI